MNPIRQKINDWYQRSHLSSEKGGFKLLSGVEVPDAWAPYTTQQNDEYEIIHRPLWDTQTVATNQSANLNYFASQQATTDLGNEVFPLKNSYLCAAIGLFFKDTAQGDTVTAIPAANDVSSRVNDHALITNTGILAILINGKDYGPWPLWKLIPGAGIWGIMSGGGTPGFVNYSQMGPPDPRAMFKLAIPLVMPMNTKITMSAQWPGGALSLSRTSKACLILDGKEAIAR